MPVNLLGLPVATQQTTQDPHAAHPGQLLGHTSVGSTLSLTWTHNKDTSSTDDNANKILISFVFQFHLKNVITFCFASFNLP